MMTSRPLVVLCTVWIAGNVCAALLPGSAFWFVWWGVVIWIALCGVLVWVLSRHTPLCGERVSSLHLLHHALLHHPLWQHVVSHISVDLLWRSSLLVLPRSSQFQMLAATLRFILCIMVVFVTAAAYWHWNDERNTSQLSLLLAQPHADITGQRAEVTGVIVGAIEIDGDRVRFPLELYRVQSFRAETSDSETGVSSTDEVKTQTPIKTKTATSEMIIPETAASFVDNQLAANPVADDRKLIVLQKHETIMIQLKLARQQELQRAYEWQRGDRIMVTGSWKQPGIARNFGTFDYRQYLHRHHIHWLLEAAGADALRPANIQLSVWAEQQLSLLRWNEHIRQQLGAQIKRIFWQADQGYMKGLLIGDTDDIDPESFAAFSRLGLTHILAISGLHIAIYVGLLLWLLRRIGLTKESACLIVMVLLPFYVLLTGASPSAIRAGLMGMIGLYLASRGLLKDGLHLLCLVGWLMLMYEPYYLLDVSFQLSFAVTAGLIVYVPLLSVLLARLPARIGSAVAVTLVAQFISFPLTIYYFNQFSLLSFVANFVLVPVSGLLVLPIGTLALAVSYIGLPAGVWLGSCVSWLNRWCFWLVEWLDDLPGMLTIWASPGLWQMLAYYGLLYVALRCMRDIQQWLEQHADDPLYTQPTLASDRISMSKLDSKADERYGLDVRTVVQTHHLDMDAERENNAPHLRSTRSGKFGEADGFVGADTFPPVDILSASVRTGKRSISFWRLYIRRGLHWQLVWTRSRLSLLPVMLLAISLLLGYWYDASHHDEDGMVQFLDIGQGDSILITTPTGKHILVDGGGTVNFRLDGQQWRQRKQPYEVGNKLLVPLLKKRGVHELDAVIATHWDQDHVGGLEAVIEAIPVRRWIFNGTMPDHHQRDRMMRSLLDKHIPMYAPVAGMTMEPDAYTRLDFLAPIATGISDLQPTATDEAFAKETVTWFRQQDAVANPLPLPIQEDQNSHSIVFMLTLYGRHILFTGDADTVEEHSILYNLQKLQAKQEPQMKQTSQMNRAISSYGAVAVMNANDTNQVHVADIANLPIITPPIDVLKVGHHGSKSSTSAEWLAHWQPRLSVISVGENNRYGHPKAEVLDRLTAVHSMIARTDQQGEIQLRIAPSGEMTIRSMLEKSRKEK